MMFNDNTKQFCHIGEKKTDIVIKCKKIAKVVFNIFVTVLNEIRDRSVLLIPKQCQRIKLDTL